MLLLDVAVVVDVVPELEEATELLAAVLLRCGAAPAPAECGHPGVSTLGIGT